LGQDMNTRVPLNFRLAGGLSASYEGLCSMNLVIKLRCKLWNLFLCANVNVHH